MSRDQWIQVLWDENRGKVLSLLLIILLLAGLQIYQSFQVTPQLEISSVQLEKSRTELRQAQQRVVTGGGAKISGIADDLERFYRNVPLRSDLGSFIGLLYSYAGDAGIDIDQISYAAKFAKETALLGYQLGFAVSGSYSQVKKFIYLLEKSPSLLIVQKISLDEARKEQKEIVRLQIQLQTFFREEEQ